MFPFEIFFLYIKGADMYPFLLPDSKPAVQDRHSLEWVNIWFLCFLQQLAKHISFHMPYLVINGLPCNSWASFVFQVWHTIWAWCRLWSCSSETFVDILKYWEIFEYATWITVFTLFFNHEINGDETLFPLYCSSFPI